MKYYFFILFLVIQPLTKVEGQPLSIADSTKNKIASLPAHERIDYLHHLIVNTWLNYPTEAMYYANEAMRLSDSIGDLSLSSKSIRLKGGVHYYLGNYDSTVLYTKESLAIANAIKDSVLIDNALNNLGLVYYNLGSYQNALENLLRSLKLKEIGGEVYGRAQTLNNVGLVYNKLKYYEKARDYFQKGLDFAVLHKDLNLQLFSLNNIGGTYLSLDDYDKAGEYFEQSKNLKVDNKNWNAVTLSGLAQVALQKGEYEKASKLFGEALKLRNEIDDKNGVSEIYYFYAKDAQIRQNYDSALYFLGESEKIAERIGSKDRMFDNYELYVKLYSQLGNMQKAFDYQTELMKLRDELFNESMARNLSEIQLKLQQEEASELLSHKEQQLSESRNITIFLTIIVLLVGVVFIMILLAFINNRKVNRILASQNEEINQQKEEITQKKESLKQKNIDLKEAHKLIKQQNDKLEKYNERLLQTVDERTQELEESNERLKMANLELDNFIYKSSHDIKGPLATLLGICNVALLDIKDDHSREYFTMLAETARGLNQILSRLKTVSDINSYELDVRKIDFKSIIEKSIDQVINIEGVRNVNIEYAVEDNIHYEADPFLLDLIVFNMIHNAIRFQKDNAEEIIDIRITQEENRVVMHFRDNGIGIDKEDTENIFHIYSKSAIKHQSLGLGLYLVKQCIQRLGGEIMLVDEDDLTHFRVELPIG